MRPDLLVEHEDLWSAEHVEALLPLDRLLHQLDLGRNSIEYQSDFQEFLLQFCGFATSLLLHQKLY